MADEEQLKRSRTNIKSSVTKILTYTNNFDTSSAGDINQLKIRDKRLDSLLEEYNHIQSELEAINLHYSSDRDAFEDAYYSAKAAIMSAYDESQPVVNSNIQSKQSVTQVSADNIRLPEIQIPKFDGSYSKWRDFQDVYISIIHNNARLTDLQKLHYLKNAVYDDAADCIGAITMQAANYKVAWELLIERYDNKERIVNSHLKVLFELPQINRGNTAGLRSLITTSKQHLRSLEVMGLPVSEWDAVIVYLLKQKLDKSVRRSWHLSKNSSNLATLAEFFEFLQKQCTAEELYESNEQRDNSGRDNRNQAAKQLKFSHTHVSVNKPTEPYSGQSNYSDFSCAVCNVKGHGIFRCNVFLKQSIQDRINTVKAAKLCFNCLRGQHSASECKSSHCRVCQRSHNTLLHLEPASSQAYSGHSVNKDANKPSNNKVTAPKTDTGSVTVMHNNIHTDCGQILLSTVEIKVLDAAGKWQLARALLDGGAQSNFISAGLMDKLNVITTKTEVKVKGVCETNTLAKRSATLAIKARVGVYQTKLEFLVLNKITSNLPVKPIDVKSLSIPEGIVLADPSFYRPQPVDMLLGAELFYEILNQGKVNLGKRMPVLQNTKLGWIIGGKLGKQGDSTHAFFLRTEQENLDKKIEKFWECENIPTSKPILTAEELQCEEHFAKTYKRDDTGRYIVQLPLRDTYMSLGNSFDSALKRLQSLQNKFTHNQELCNEYSTFINEYRDLNHMKLIYDVSNNSPQYYMPHHAVFKDSSTTRIRVVFDASMKTSNGRSLNDEILVGPTLHQDLFSIILRFRTHKYAFSADIKKMFRQIIVEDKHSDLQRILWFNQITKQLEIYALNTVAYGTACGPYLATKSLQQLAIDEQEHFSEVVRIVIEDFFVDDVMSGADTIQGAIKYQQLLTRLLLRGGFELHKWCSNNEAILSNVPADIRETQLPLELGKGAVKTLGLFWLPAEDSFKFAVTLKPLQPLITKRTVLSDIASIFDPLGLLNPIVVRAKLFMQLLWKQSLDWDEQLSTIILQDWLEFRSSLGLIKDISAPRLIIPSQFHGNLKYIQIHGYSDASTVAYGGCLYLRCEDIYGNISVQLICAKSRVAPIKQLSLPRLELCGMLTLSRLINQAVTSLQLNVNDIYMWTDSTIVLSWLNAHPSRWQTFVGNRVSEIQQTSETFKVKWRHISSADNPADCLSRGLSPSELKFHTLWWTGPNWLSLPEDEWPTSIVSLDTIEERAQVQKYNLHVRQETFTLFDQYSSYDKLCHVTAYILRFKNNCISRSQPTCQINKGHLTVSELKNAVLLLCNLCQNEYYHSEFKAIADNQLNKSNKLSSLTPFVDENGLLRVRGRLQQADMPYETKHPIILPPSHKFTILLIEHAHKLTCHGGTQVVLTYLRQRYWIVNGRSTVRHIIHKCLTCTRYRAQTQNQVMGNLPSARVSMVPKAFTSTGLDYGGPILIKTSSRRNAPKSKGYIALFVCMATRAIHLELVSSLSTESFMQALRRFIARRGLVSHIFSDNATNFQGAKHELHDLYKLFQKPEFQDTINSFTVNREIQWSFIPPQSPNFGGIWESGIKSVKHHIRRILGLTTPTFEELSTLLSSIEAIVNSRPICALTSDPNDNSVLTPGHFLIGCAPLLLPQTDLAGIPENRLNRWQMVQLQTQQFWKRWSTEYLHSLQQRNKWKLDQPNLHTDSIVLIKEDNLPPSHWKLGRVLEVHPDKEGKVRVATIKTATGVFKRGINKLCLLRDNTF